MKQYDLILPKSDILLSGPSEINELCKPLQRFGINYVSHTRIYEDGSFIDVSNNSAVMDYYYYQTDLYKEYTPDIMPDIVGGGMYLCSSFGCAEPIRHMRELFGIDNVIVIIEPHDDYYEVWNIGSDRTRHNAIEFYYNNQDLLKAFTYYFKDKGATTIKKYEQDKIKRQISTPHLDYLLSKVQLHNTEKDAFISEMEAERYYVYKDTYLTKREYACLRYLTNGFTAKEIAQVLNLSSKTIEYHLQSIKTKCNVTKKSQLVRLAKSLNILD